MDLVGVIQQIIQANLDAQKLTELEAGTVTSASPLKIKVTADLPDLPEDVFVLTEAVKAWNEEAVVDYPGGTSQTVTIHHKGLQVGDKVVLLRVLKGQKYIILSRA